MEDFEMEKKLFVEEENLTVVELQEELDQYTGDSVTANTVGGIGTVLCMSGFNSYIDTCYGNKDVLFLNSDEGIGCDIHVEDIKEIKKDFMGQLYIKLKNEQTLQISSENHGLFEYAKN